MKRRGGGTPTQQPPAKKMPHQDKGPTAGASKQVPLPTQSKPGGKKRRFSQHSGGGSSSRDQSPDEKRSTVNVGNYYEEILGAYVLTKLCERKDVSDWRLGMQMKQKFSDKLDDVVIGLKEIGGAEFSYFAIQMKGYDDKGGEIEKAFTSYTALKVLKKKEEAGKDFNFWNHFVNGFLKVDSYYRKRTKKFILYTEHELKINSQVKYKSQDDRELFRDPSEETVKEIKSFLPPMKDAVLKRIRESAVTTLIRRWEDEGYTNYSKDDLKNFVSKFVFVSNQPSHEKISEWGNKRVNNWELLKSKISRFRVDGKTPWISLEMLMENKVKFQGENNAVKMCDLIDNPTADLLRQLFIDPEKLSVGNEVRGPREKMKHKYYIERTIEHEVDGTKIAITLEELFKEKKVVIIEGQSGLGKSTTLAHAAMTLKEKEKSKTWIIELNASSLKPVFMLTKASDALEMLRRAALPKVTEKDSPLRMLNCDVTHKCFKKLIRNHGSTCLNIGLFVDGIDEVKDEHKHIIFQMISLLNDFSNSNNSCFKTMWISSQSYLKNDIERSCFINKPNQPSTQKWVTISQFKLKDQINFLKMYWGLKKPTEIESITRKLKSMASAKMGEVIKSPLMTRMLADIYNHDRKKFLSDMYRNQNEVWLFDRFVEKIYKYARDKFLKIAGNNKDNVDMLVYKSKENYLLQHGLTSLKHLYPTPDADAIVLPTDRLGRDAFISSLNKIGKVNSGIITISNDGKLQYTHGMFAAYYAARWFFDTLARLVINLPLTKSHLDRLIEFLQVHHTKPANLQVRTFLAYMAAEGYEKHTEIVTRMQSLIIMRNTHLQDEYIKAFEEHSLVEDKLGRQLFHLALESGHLSSAIKLKVGEKSFSADNLWDLILRNEWLLVASKYGDCENARGALKCGADVNHKWRLFTHQTALHLACKRGDAITAVMLLTEYDADANIGDIYGDTPLHYALKICTIGMPHVGAMIVCELLKNAAVRRRIDVNATNNVGNTPLHIACKKCQYSEHRKLISAIDMLLVSGSDINIHNRSGKTPYQYAKMCSEKVMKRLILYGNLTNYMRAHADADGMTSLHIACEFGDLKCAELLLERGADVNATDNYNQRPLHYAVEEGTIAAVKMLLGRVDLEVNAADSDRRTPLHVAATLGQSEIVRLLLLNGADIDAVCEENKMPLHYASSGSEQKDGCIAILYMLVGKSDILLKDKVDVNAKDTNKRTPLHHACGNPDAVKALLENGADINPTDLENMTPLNSSCKLYKTRNEAAKLLISCSADATIADKNGKTPLHYASESRDLTLMNMLLGKSEVDVNAKDINDKTPFHYACESSRSDAFMILLVNGADISAVDKDGKTTLHYSCESGHFDAVKTLLGKGVQTNVVDKVKKMTPLHYACCGMNSNQLLTAIIKMLLGKSDVAVSIIANIHAVDAYGCTPIHYACGRADAGVVRILIENGANTLAVDNRNQTSLHFACGNSWPEVEIINILLEKSDVAVHSIVDVNSEDLRVRTPLHKACKALHSEAAQLLIKNGADVNAADADGKTPLHLAFKSAEKWGDDVLPLVEWILTREASLTVVDKENKAPLHYASRRIYSKMKSTVERIQQELKKSKSGILNATSNREINAFPLEKCRETEVDELAQYLNDHGDDPSIESPEEISDEDVNFYEDGDRFSMLYESTDTEDE